MYNKKSRAYEIAEQDEEVQCCSLRCWLLVWGILRLIPSVLWTGVIIISILAQLLGVRSRFQPPSVFGYGSVSIIVQLVEFAMLVTFITAGVKKSASLYRAYYRYCILALIIYIIAVVLVFILDYAQGHWLAEIYLTYHITDYLPIVQNDALVFGIASGFSICLEVLLICLIKKMINQCSSYA